MQWRETEEQHMLRVYTTHSIQDSVPFPYFYTYRIPQ